jgi:hypothetical protein
MHIAQCRACIYLYHITATAGTQRTPPSRILGQHQHFDLLETWHIVDLYSHVLKPYISSKSSRVWKRRLLCSVILYIIANITFGGKSFRYSLRKASIDLPETDQTADRTSIIQWKRMVDFRQLHLTPARTATEPTRRLSPVKETCNPDSIWSVLSVNLGILHRESLP